MSEIRKARRDELVDLIEIWRRSVRATHGFLSETDFKAMEIDVAGKYLPAAALWVAVDTEDRPLAFMGLKDAHIDSLFVEPDMRGKGIGKNLLTRAREMAGQHLTVDVNEQNDEALGFYQRMGFEITGRSPRDGDGRPYPLLHMNLRIRR